MKKRDFSKISIKFFKKFSSAIGIGALFIFLFICFQIYIPVNPDSSETVVFAVEKGWSDDEIAIKLKEAGLIRSKFFFQFYVIASFKDSDLQAGKYSLSPRLSSYKIANKMAMGDIIREKITILEGWDIKDIGEYLESKKICTEKEFEVLAQQDYSDKFEFLKDKPRKLSLEGYIFPDTYEIAGGDNCEEVILVALQNFDEKLTIELREEITKQEKSIFDIVTMASMIEKEVRTIEDKKIVSGILWKRIAAGMALQLDATVNYITGKHDPAVSIKDTKIDSPYNTYKYKGLPKGPISNPGIESIKAALYPTKTAYWYYLSNGRIIYAKTGEEHLANRNQHLK